MALRRRASIVGLACGEQLIAACELAPSHARALNQ